MREPLGKHIMQCFKHGDTTRVFLVWRVLPDTALGFLELRGMDC